MKVIQETRCAYYIRYLRFYYIKKKIYFNRQQIKWQIIH